MKIFTDFFTNSFKITPEKKKTLKNNVPLISGFFFLIAIFVPSMTMLQNTEDYSGSYINYFIPFFFSFSILALITIAIVLHLKKEIRSVIRIILLWLMLASYVQYMFLNIHLSIIVGKRFSYMEHPGWTFIDLLIWLIILAVIIVLYIKKKKIFAKIIFYAPIYLLLMWCFTLLFTLVTAPEKSREPQTCAFVSDDQFSVGTGDNIIVLIFDAIDNTFINELLENEPEQFEPFSDFTLYTNTCSVFDKTTRSMPQMFSGCDFYGEGTDYKAFYDRLHENDYTINFYNYHDAEDFVDVKPYVDNYVALKDAPKGSLSVDYSDILSKTSQMTAYFLLPDILKETIDVYKINFISIVKSNHSKNPHNVFWNKDFNNAVHLEINEDIKNSLIMQHTYGAHPPCDYLEETCVSLDSAKKYIEQLKELGVYENSTIIIVSDHGKHDYIDDNEDSPFAATPMFMIHSKGEKHDSLQLTNAPEYHRDLIATILVNAGLYNSETDKELFGSPIYDFSENETRERIWYDSPVNNYTNFSKYVYSGDMHTLEDKVKNGEPDEIIDIAE